MLPLTSAPSLSFSLRRSCRDKQDKLDWITAENSEWEDDKTHNRAIHIAAQNGHEKFTAKLIAAGADVNSKNGTGSTALHMARSYDYAAICDMCVSAAVAVPRACAPLACTHPPPPRVGSLLPVPTRT